MTNASFDPGGFFEFDLANGAVHARRGGRMLVLSDAVVAPLVSAAVNNGDLTAVRKLGRQLGESAAEDLSPAPAKRSADEVLSHAGTLLGLFGWGRLRVDRWGDALVARLESLPQLDDDHLGIAALLGGMFSALAGEEVACVPISDEGAFLLVDPSVAQQVWKWARGGEGLAGIVGRLAIPEGA